MALPVNFKDDVLASSMDGKRRYNMITNSDGTVSFEDVTTYSQEGSNFGSAQINNTNGAINKINNNVLDTIEEISANTSGGKFAGALALKNVNNSLVANNKHFYFDYKNGKYGYNTNPNRGADTFVPFSNIKYQYKDVTGLQLGAFVSQKITYDFSDICEQILGVCGCGFPTESLEPFTFVFPSEVYPNIISINSATVTISLRRVYGTDMGAPVNYRIWFACI